MKKNWRIRVYANELTVRYRLQRLSVARHAQSSITTSTQAAAALQPLLRREVVEVAILLCLNTRLELLAYHKLGRGTLDYAIVHPRDVYRTALLANASAVVLGHNHPSGDPQPSSDDVELTRRLVAASAVMGIPLHDPVIVAADGRWFSFTQAGQL
jgi:DNA repair protein RadC